LYVSLALYPSKPIEVEHFRSPPLEVPYLISTGSINFLRANALAYFAKITAALTKKISFITVELRYNTMKPLSG
jgi:hypothetical protein